MVMRAIINLLRSIPVVHFVFSILLNIVMNLHLKIKKLHFEVNITMIKYAFKIESFLHHFLDAVLLSFQYR